MWRTNLKVIGVVLGTLALYTLIANKIPQIQSDVPQSLSFGANVTSEQLVAAGDKLFNGAGGCTACHGLGTRAPNLVTDEKGAGPIGARCGKREAGKSCKQYLFESLDNPTAYVVAGYQPIMPRMTAQLSPPQIWSIIAFLESQGGTVDGRRPGECGERGSRRRLYGSQGHHRRRRLSRLSHAGRARRPHRTRPDARRRAPLDRFHPQEDSRSHVVDRQGI